MDRYCIYLLCSSGGQPLSCGCAEAKKENGGFCVLIRGLDCKYLKRPGLSELSEYDSDKILRRLSNSSEPIKG